jgi:hypothetical protein
MTFPSVLFDQMIRELGELVSIRNAALTRPEIAATPSVAAAFEALKEAVIAVGRVASAPGGRAPELDQAQAALARARRAFAAAQPIWPDSRHDAGWDASPASSGTEVRRRPA